ncbi:MULTISPECIES: hypothetical protein [Bacillus]|uniref:hypothetical protein n=1 Tax=Bacillus TaxID=1386 RepID=UPI0002E76D94|nr:MULTISPECIES: hypothetical protein [Bacillus]
MEIFSLSGPSGTGKSTCALTFAHQKKIPAIIDDGLLIINGYRIAGTSAKYEKNSLSAVKRAIFFDDTHAKEVMNALKIFFTTKILIIGTSDKMTKAIAERLQLGTINYFFHIEDIRSLSEIKMAQYVRKTEGKHIIPVPYKQVEQNFFKKLIQKGMEIFSKKERIGETTIVHPDFHRNSIYIDKKVFKDIIDFTCIQNKYVNSCDNIQVHIDSYPKVSLNVEIFSPSSFNIFEKMKELQNEIQQNFLLHLNIDLISIDIRVTSTVKM